MMAAKQKTLAETLSELRTKKGVRIGSLSDFDMAVQSITTGNIAIDAITGVGGLPRGRITEAFGPPSSGKTTLALQAAAALQQVGGKILYLDYEKALDEGYCAALGLDTNDAETFFYMQPAHFEQGINVFRAMMGTGELDMLIADSVAAMVTEKELEGETGKVGVADRAKLMHQTMRQVSGPIHDHNIVAYFLNHVQEVIDASPMGQKLRSAGVVRKTTPGGSALKFYASMRLEFKQTGNLRAEVLDPVTNEKVSDVRQTKVQVTVVKNKVAPPFRQCEVRVRYGRGFSQAHSVLGILTAHNKIKKGAAGLYTFTEETAPKGSDVMTIRGEENLVAQLEEDPEWLERLRGLAQTLLDEHGSKVAEGKYTAEGDVVVDEESGEMV